MEDENVVVDNSNTTEEEVLETSEEVEQEEGESVDEYKSRLQKAEELANNYKIRAEKAERMAKGKTETPIVQPNNQQISIRDAMALMSAGVHEDDIIDVEEYAKFKKLSLADALKTGVVKTMLNEKVELRKSAAAANTGNVRRGVSKVSGESLLEKARSGDVPNDPDALAKARFEEMKNKNKR